MVESNVVYLEPCRPKRPGDGPAARIDSLDPDAMIRSALAGLADPATSAEDLFVAWLMALPRRFHPAEAAALLLTAYQPSGGRPRTPLGRRVLDLLCETAGLTQSERLARPARQGGPAVRRAQKMDPDC
jgi:hypothetical protein